MSRTLFAYLFRDLLKIFGLAAGALAGIMSFGGLLRPFQEHGLDGEQVVRVLAWLSPAMSTYSLPVAALFATTFVYGRLSSDNELTACRAAGMSYWSVLTPAAVLGTLIAGASLLLLCFVVPAATLRVERVIFSNLAGLVATQIDRTRQITLKTGGAPITLYARDADILPTGDDREQAVRLSDVLIVTYREEASGTSASAAGGPKVVTGKPGRVIDEVFTAAGATARFTLAPEGDPTADPLIRVSLEGGTKFPRATAGRSEQAVAAGVGASRFGPVPLESLIRENSKFMDIRRLHAMIERPQDGRLVAGALADFVRDDQRAAFLNGVTAEIARDGEARFDAGPGEAYALSYRPTVGADRRSRRSDAGRPPAVRRGVLSVGRGSDAPPPEVAGSDAETPRPVRLERYRDGRLVLAADAAGATLRAAPDNGRGRVAVTVDLFDVEVTAGAVGPADDPPPDDGGVANEALDVGDADPSAFSDDALASTARSAFEKRFAVAMTPDVAALADATLGQYLAEPDLESSRVRGLWRAYLKQTNAMVSEVHARLSFAASCLVLTLLGGALGMLTRSGNFLSAFAVSVAPAILGIMLIVTGQHVAENVPYFLSPDFQNPLTLGVTVIWTGNLLVLMLTGGLYWRLARS